MNIVDLNRHIDYNIMALIITKRAAGDEEKEQKKSEMKGKRRLRK